MLYMLVCFVICALKAQSQTFNTFDKSWISVQLNDDGPIAEGESFSITADWYLHPDDMGSANTSILISMRGPWVDVWDGIHTFSYDFKHHPYPGFIDTRAHGITSPGHGSKTWSSNIPNMPYDFNDLIVDAYFRADSVSSPWESRIPGPILEVTNDYYDLRTSKPGNLFTYNETVVIDIVSRAGAVAGQNKTMWYELIDAYGQTTGGSITFTVAPVGSATTVSIPVSKRGHFLLVGDVYGWGERDIIFARIPDVRAIIGSEPTLFGVSNVQRPCENEIAAKLGFNWVRHFFPWEEVEPGENEFYFNRWDDILQHNVNHGLTPWLCLDTPPAWVQVGAEFDPNNDINEFDPAFEPYGFDPSKLANSVTVMTSRWQNLIWGWEWQNEILPGDIVDDPVETYYQFVKTGTEAAKAVDPELITQLAGGLWPPNFRQDLFARGITDYIDVLPVHYGGMDDIIKARNDLATQGEADRILITNNETSAGLSTFNQPKSYLIEETYHSEYILQNWPDMLSAGATQIIYFGGQIDAGGNWSYLLDEHTTRPVASTLAVLISKLARATPLGKFYFGDGAVAHLFDRDGQAVVIVSAPNTPGYHTLNLGASVIKVTDYQGNESYPTTWQGRLSANFASMPVIIEGGNLDALKTARFLQLTTSEIPNPNAQVVAVQGQSLKIPVQLTNLYDVDRPVELEFRRASETTVAHTLNLTVPAGHTDILQVDIPVTTGSGSEEWIVEAHFTGTYLPKAVKSIIVNWVDPSTLGNQVENGGFENGTADWYLFSGSVINANGGLGLGDSYVELSGSDSWMQARQEIDIQGGQSFIYSAWMQSSELEQGGSELTYKFADGSSQVLYATKIFQTPSTSQSWRYVSYTGTAPEGITSVVITPIAKRTSGANGWLRMDNVRLTIDEGSSFSTEAAATENGPVIDGDLSDWNSESPIPLLAENLLKVNSGSYNWTPSDLSGVAYLQWDAEALYLAAEVMDDSHAVPYTGESTPQSDGLSIAIQPYRLGESYNDQAFMYYFSAASPGSGSGSLTLYRPAAYSGGLSSGQLAVDSSSYELFINRSGNRTYYELKMPWSELGGLTPSVGSKLGLSLRLSDNDGAGWAASMTWGGGIQPAWAPTQFGVMTLTNPDDVTIDPDGPTEGAYSEWASTQGFANNSDAAAEADPDSDGLPNLLEYALDTSALAASSGVNEQPAVSLTAAEELNITFERSRADLTYKVVVSDDLVNWSIIATDPGQLGSSVTVTDFHTTSTERYIALIVSNGSDYAHTTPFGRRFLNLVHGQTTTVKFNLLGEWGSGFGGEPVGVITGLGWNTLSNSNAGWTAGALANGVAPTMLQITSGSAAGEFFPVKTSAPNTSSQLTLVNDGQDLRNLGINVNTDTYALTPADTFSSLFPAGVLQSGSSSTADVISVYEPSWDGSFVLREYYHNGSNWYGNWSNADNVIVRPDLDYTILRRGPTASFIFTGRIDTDIPPI